MADEEGEREQDQQRQAILFRQQGEQISGQRERQIARPPLLVVAQREQQRHHDEQERQDLVAALDVRDHLGVDGMDDEQQCREERPCRVPQHLSAQQRQQQHGRCRIQQHVDEVPHQDAVAERCLLERERHDRKRPVGPPGAAGR